MGTLFNQPPRNSWGNDEKEFDKMAELIEYGVREHNYTIEQSIEICKVLEMQRENNFRWENGNIFDEQLAGFGELLQAYGGTMTEFRVILEEYLRGK